MRRAPRRCNDSLVLAILPPLLAILFWLWLGVSLVVLVVRLIRRLTRTTPATGDPAPASGSVPAQPTGPVPRASWASAPPEPDFAVDRDLDPPLDRPPPLPAPATPHGGGRGGVFASKPEASGGRATVVEALQGIVMPCNLTPVIDGSVSIPSPFRVAFLTTDADAVTVGVRLGDELERLGFTLSTMATTELLARRPGAEIRVTVYPTANAARRGIDPIFPAAPDGAVGVEFAT